eukprot:TRINITY_DN14375_c0_g1_i1.p1 TRINITY_DN14375_c0_g1~~TRINITY_DN14375_c0_g1_i1.p1  ORF type:complete len:369 (+),score=77.56 TRINITY_DN14375_c0_g1_i1:42-1109(+)
MSRQEGETAEDLNLKFEAPIKLEFRLPHTAPATSPAIVGEKRPGDQPKAESKREQKRRRFEAKQANKEVGICKLISQGRSCPHGDQCKFGHDTVAYLAAKPADLGDQCYVFSQTGRCPFGLSCRFAGAHTRDGKTVVTAEVPENAPISGLTEGNMLDRDIQNKLRRHSMKFPKAEPIIKAWNDDQKRRQKLEAAQRQKSQQAVNAKRDAAAPPAATEPTADPAAVPAASGAAESTSDAAASASVDDAVAAPAAVDGSVASSTSPSGAAAAVASVPDASCCADESAACTLPETALASNPLVELPPTLQQPLPEDDGLPEPQAAGPAAPADEDDGVIEYKELRLRPEEIKKVVRHLS